MSLGFVYISLGKDFLRFTGNDYFKILIKAVATSIEFDDGKPLVKNIGGKQVVCEGKTRKYIAFEATRFIERFERVHGEKHMALAVSKTQIDRLIRLLSKKDYRLSCYSLVILHIIYTHINQSERNDYKEQLNKLVELIRELADNYLEYYQDELALYILDCYPSVSREVNTGEIVYPHDFPAVHRFNPFV